MALKRNSSFLEYRRLSRRKARPVRGYAVERPAGELVWLHAGAPADIDALLDLSERLVADRPGLTVLLTRPPEQERPADAPGPAADHTPEIVQIEAPVEHPEAILEFLNHWTPDLCLWVWGSLRPNLIDLSFARGIPMHLVSAATAGFEPRRDPWIPVLGHHLLACFDTASTRSAGCARRLARLGFTPRNITVLPALQAFGRVLDCAESDRIEVTAQLQGRPVWYASGLAPGEWHAVLHAHLIAMRSAHRLLLVVHVEDRSELESIRHFLDTYGLLHANWDDGETARESTQVLLTDAADEAGLWFRIAAVTFLGNSLGDGGAGHNPMPAAQLGCAIVHGPRIDAYADQYARLTEAGAARLVRDAEGLGETVGHLIIPAHTAEMAQNGWSVATDGVEVIDSVVDLVRDVLGAPQKSPA